jgi:hypothetical protein
MPEISDVKLLGTLDGYKFKDKYNADIIEMLNMFVINNTFIETLGYILYNAGCHNTQDVNTQSYGKIMNWKHIFSAVDVRYILPNLLYMVIIYDH